MVWEEGREDIAAARVSHVTLSALERHVRLPEPLEISKFGMYWGFFKTDL